MALIDSTYFVLDIAIPDSEYSNLDEYIVKYEREILMRLFGYELYTFVAAYNPNSEQRIKDIVLGKEYTVNGKLAKWNGLINDDKESLIAYYTYYWYVRNNATTLQTTGMMKMVSENAAPVSAIQKLSAAYIRFEELQKSAYDYLTNHIDQYPEWEYTEEGSVNIFDL